MAMNNVVYDQLTGMPINPVASQQQAVPTPGMPVTNAAVYNNQRAIEVGNAVYGSPQIRQQSVMMTAAQENTFGPEGTNPNPEIYNAIKNK